MKRVLFLLFAVALITACNTNQQKRYFSASPEIEVTKLTLKHYLAQNWDEYKQHYSDTAKFRNNVTEEKEISLDSVIVSWKLEHEMFSDIHYVAAEDYFEMVLTDEGETWVNYWGLWKGTLKASGEEFEIPVHITQRYENQKIVLEHGYWNSSAIALALAKLEASTQ